MVVVPPRFKPDGTRNATRLKRLEDELGNWSNASSEVELQGSCAVMLIERARPHP